MRWILRMFLFFVAWRAFGPIISPRFKPPQRHPWRVPGRTVFVGDDEFLVRQIGPDDGEPLLLIHGLSGSSLAEWYRVGPALAENYRVIMVDHRSHGLSALARGRFEVENLADDVAGVLDELGVGQVTVLGYSMGGTIAQALAHRHPNRVKNLILMATFTHTPQPDRALRTFGALLIRAWERLTGFGVPETRSGYLLATRAVEESHARWLWEETHRRDVDAGAQASLALLRFDSRPWIGRLPHSTLLFIPTRDQLVPVPWQYDLAASLKTPVVVEIAGARHEIPWTHPEMLVKEITTFLA